MSQASETGVVYLARGVEGIAPMRRFLESYRALPAGLPHDLIVVFKAFADDQSRREAGELFASVPHRAIDTDDLHFDIGAYLQVAGQVDHQTLCFTNTYSEILAPNWLSILREGLHGRDVGMVGATASYESLYNSIHLLIKVCWLINEKRIPFSDFIANHFHFVFNPNAEPRWRIDMAWLPAQIAAQPPLTDLPPVYFQNPETAAEFEKFWQRRIALDGDLSFVADFARFPNPHIRSNCFIMDRAELLSFFPEFRPETKDDAFGFESGPGSLTSRLKQSGRRILLADRLGQYWTEERWPASRTFRLARQEDLLVADSQTQRFDRMTPWEKNVHTAMTWGDAVIGATEAPYTLGDEFRTGLPSARIADYADAGDYGVSNGVLASHNVIDSIQRPIRPTGG